ncbi:MAG TPA: SAM-dependent chlorinase/fluorinase, partial [Pyrinomonadaceae bacterium]
DIEAGAFTLLAAYKSFPSQTIHLGVVDPGVGSARRPLLVSGGGHFFVGPDNGLFGYIFEREPEAIVFHLTREEYFRQPLSRTFHGRDIFAPVAGALSLGAQPEELGEEITDYQRLAPLAPKSLTDGSLEARIIHIDRFGNCITNLTREHLTEEMMAAGARLLIKGHEIKSFRPFFAAEAIEDGELFVIEGSAGFLEIAAYLNSAARLLDAERGQEILVSSSGLRGTKQPDQF